MRTLTENRLCSIVFSGLWTAFPLGHPLSAVERELLTDAIVQAAKNENVISTTDIREG